MQPWGADLGARVMIDIAGGIYHDNRRLIGDHERRRAVALMALGFSPLDALHVACGESAGAEVLLTTDDRLLKLALRRAGDLQVPLANPLRWLEEQML